MQIQVNSDKNIEVDRQLVLSVRDNANRKLRPFKDKLTRVEFHLSDVNGRRSRKLDKRCLAEARPARYRPLVVWATAPTVQAAVQISLTKPQSALATLFGRLTTRRMARKRTAKALLPTVGRRVTQPKELVTRLDDTRSRKKSVSTTPRSATQGPAKKVAVESSKGPARAGHSPKKKKIEQRGTAVRRNRISGC